MATPTTAIGIDFGGTSIKSAVVRDGAIVARGTLIDPQAFATSTDLIDELVRLADSLRSKHGDIVGVGIGLPGFVDSLRGIVHSLTNVAGWHEVPLCQILRERTGLAAAIENDVKAMTYAEWKHGAARGAQHAVCITLGTGVGGGLILDGRLYRGSQFAAGEIGHASIDYRGLTGPYGNFGGLEEYVGNSQIAGRAAKLYAAAGLSKTIDECNPKALDQAAHAGDQIALGLWETLGTEIGAALANVVWILNPETIVIGGGVAKAGELLLVPIRREINARTSEVFHDNLRVLPAMLGNEAGMIGCAELALEAAKKLTDNQ
jgi:glucokinase